MSLPFLSNLSGLIRHPVNLDNSTDPANVFVGRFVVNNFNSIQHTIQLPSTSVGDRNAMLFAGES